MERVLDHLIAMWEFDLWAFSQWWMYVFVVPVCFYLPFFFLKWAVVTAPVWLPFALIFRGAVQVKQKQG